MPVHPPRLHLDPSRFPPKPHFNALGPIVHCNTQRSPWDSLAYMHGITPKRTPALAPLPPTAVEARAPPLCSAALPTLPPIALPATN
jgi:hypothetical protein